MKAAQYAKYFIRIILAICAIAILFTIVHVMTPKIDVFSCVGVHWTAEHPQKVTCTFHPDFFAEKVLELKPKADIQDVENLAKSIQVKVDIIDSPVGIGDGQPIFPPDAAAMANTPGIYAGQGAQECLTAAQ